MSDYLNRMRCYFNAKTQDILQKKTGMIFENDEQIKKYTKKIGIYQDIFEAKEYKLGIGAIFERLMKVYNAKDMNSLAVKSAVNLTMLNNWKTSKNIDAIKLFCTTKGIHGKVFGYKHFLDFELPKENTEKIANDMKDFYDNIDNNELAKIMNVEPNILKTWILNNDKRSFISALYENDLENSIIRVAYGETPYKSIKPKLHREKIKSETKLYVEDLKKQYGVTSVAGLCDTLNISDNVIHVLIYKNDIAKLKEFVNEAIKTFELKNRNDAQITIKTEETQMNKMLSSKKINKTIKNVIENRQREKFTLKIVLENEIESNTFCDNATDYIEAHSQEQEKLKTGLGLKNLSLNNVFNFCLIEYEFSNEKDSKHFNSLFNHELKDDYSNLLESLLVFEKREVKEKSTYIVKLNLPKNLLAAFEIKEISTVSSTAYPSIKINRELLSFDGKEVHLLIDDFSSELLAIKLTKAGDTYMLPQKWFDIEDRSIVGVYDTKWCMDIQNIVSFKEGMIIVSKNEKQISVAQEFIKLDGKSSRFVANGENYLDTESNIVIPKEIVVLKH